MDFKERTMKILKGDEEAPTEFIAYLSKRATESRDTGNKLVGQVQKGEASLAVLRSQIQQLKGACDGYISDIELFLEKEDQPEETDKGNGETKPFTDKERKELLKPTPEVSENV